MPEAIPDTNALPLITGEVPEPLLEDVLADAAKRAGVNVDQLEVVRSQFVEWPDGSLGCPQPGELYIQMIVPGYWVEIDGPESRYDYRADDGGNFKLCKLASHAS